MLLGQNVSAAVSSSCKQLSKFPQSFINTILDIKQALDVFQETLSNLYKDVLWEEMKMKVEVLNLKIPCVSTLKIPPRHYYTQNYKLKLFNFELLKFNT
jgi:hypothetical protein